MPGAACRKSAIFISQPKRLIGHWVEETEKKKMEAVFLENA